MSLLETGRHPMPVSHDVLVNKKSNAMLVFILFSTEKKTTLCPSSVVVSPKFFHLISQSPKMFHLYLSISCVSSWGGPAALIALVFHVPIFDDAPVESGCTAEGAVLVDPGGDRSGMVWLLVFIIW